MSYDISSSFISFNYYQSLTLSKHKSYQRLYSVNITWKLFLKFLIVTIYHTTKLEKVGFAITFLCMYHAITDCVDSHLLSVICKLLVKQALSLTHLITITTSQTFTPSWVDKHVLGILHQRVVRRRWTMSSSICYNVFKIHCRQHYYSRRANLNLIFQYCLCVCLFR